MTVLLVPKEIKEKSIDYFMYLKVIFIERYNIHNLLYINKGIIKIHDAKTIRSMRKTELNTTQDSISNLLSIKEIEMRTEFEE